MFKIIPAIFLLAFSFSVDAYNIDIGMNFQDGVSKGLSGSRTKCTGVTSVMRIE